MDEKKPIEKQFFKYALPSMLSQMLAGFYAIVDGLFIGRSTGDVGLAAINIAWPMIALLIATGFGIGTGGAVVMSLLRGQGKTTMAKRAMISAIIHLLCAALLYTVFFCLFCRQILYLLGARGEVLSHAVEYSRIIIGGCTMQILGTGVLPLLRNDGKIIHAMVIMICGMVTNIGLDAYLIMGLGWGMVGAAVATICAQALTAVCGMTLVIRSYLKEGERVPLRNWNHYTKRIFRIGISPFGLSLSPSIILMLVNFQCLRYGGDLAVAAYAVTTYVTMPMQSFLAGMGEGLQPLFSYCRGAEKYREIRILRTKAFFTLLIMGTTATVLVFLARPMVPVIFGTSAETAAIVQVSLAFGCVSLLFNALVRLGSSYFYALGEVKKSSTLIYADPVVVTPLCLLILPLIWKLNGVWLVQVVPYVILSGLLVVMFRQQQKVMGCLEE